MLLRPNLLMHQGSKALGCFMVSYKHAVGGYPVPNSGDGLCSPAHPARAPGPAPHNPREAVAAEEPKPSLCREMSAC